ncbi:glutathione S-transferase family protein [Dokdonella sp.]|uniref:glutathione S-transferase family protein n=1 Tax=Dokdonella sp. TaxID=2291710 RepID=UPI00378339C1
MSDTPLLIIGNKNYSSWSLRPWLLLRHHGVAFDEQRLLLDTPEFARTIADWSPNRAVPAMRHAGITIWDSLAICEYANETLLGGAGWPADASARAVARSVSAEMHSGFQALRKALPMNCRRRTHGTPLGPDVLANIARIGAIWRDCRARFGAGGPFLFGGFSIADAMYAPVVMRFVSYGVEIDAVAQAYVDTLLDLPALQEWLRDAAAETESLEATDRVA